MPSRRSCVFGFLLLAVGCSSSTDGSDAPPGPSDAAGIDGRWPDGSADADGGTSEDAPITDAPADSPNPGDVTPPGCGDGVVDTQIDGTTGWYVEECDEGSGNAAPVAACGADCRYRRCDQGRACGPIRSTFGAYLSHDEGEMRRFFLKMREHGLEELVIVNIGDQQWDPTGSWHVVGTEESFYDASAGPSILQQYVVMAARAGVDVVVGLSGLVTPPDRSDWEVWFNSSIRGPFEVHNLDVAAAVAQQVGSEPSFRGYYLAQEMNLGDAAQCTAAGDYYATMIAGAHGKPGLRALAGAHEITVAPYLAVGSRSPAQTGSTFRCLYDKLSAAGGIDRIMVQDGVPKEADGFTSLGNVGLHFQAMYDTLSPSERNVLWVDLETYAWPTPPCYLSRPATIGRIGDQVREVGRWVQGFSQWIHAHNFTAAGLGRDDCDADRGALGEAYMSRPFPFQAFVYQSSVVLRGYKLQSGGTARMECDTASGRQTFGFDESSGLSVHYAPSWLSDDELPKPSEIYEVTFPNPSDCTGGRVVVFVSPDGTESSTMGL